MRNRKLITTTIFAAAVLSAGSWSSSTRAAIETLDTLDTLQSSGSAQAHEVGFVEQRGDEVREEFHQIYPISATGRVSLENLNGGVRITVSDVSEVQVNAIKRAYRRERLSEARIEVNSTADAIRIKTVYPDWDQTITDDERGRYNNPAIVDYLIVVPRTARLESIDLVNGSLDIEGVEGDVKASSVNGRVTVRGLKGEAKLNTVNGGLEATFAQLVESKPLSLGSVNGNVVIVIPSDSNAVIRAETIHGAIRSDFGFTVQDGEYVGHSLYGQLGSGGPRIKLGNVNGGITIKHAQDGRAVSPVTGLSSEKDKYKNKDKTSGYSEEEIERMHAEASRIAEQVRREMDPEIRREAERALREAEREIQQAQREVQREAQRQVREQVREQMREQMRSEGRGTGTGKGRGEGYTNDRFTARESKSFSIAGTPRVNLVTFDGAITVHGWDKAEVKYTAVKHGNGEPEVNEIGIETEQQGSAISIVAKSDQGTGSASLDVFVPRNSNVQVSSGDGHLSLQGVTGEITLRTGDGSIEVTDSQGKLTVNTGDGHIRIANFQGRAEARTGDGPIELDGKFGGLTARTGDGSITLSVSPDSNFTIETNADGIDNEGLTVSEDIAPSKRVKRWKVGQGGNVFVISTGEGRIVLRRR